MVVWLRTTDKSRRGPSHPTLSLLWPRAHLRAGLGVYFLIATRGHVYGGSLYAWILGRVTSLITSPLWRPPTSSNVPTECGHVNQNDMESENVQGLLGLSCCMGGRRSAFHLVAAPVLQDS